MPAPDLTQQPDPTPTGQPTRLATVITPEWGDRIGTLRREVCAASCTTLIPDTDGPVAQAPRDDAFATDELDSRHLVALARLDQALARAEEAWVAVRRTVGADQRELGPYSPGSTPKVASRTGKTPPSHARSLP